MYYFWPRWKKAVFWVVTIVVAAGVVYAFGLLLHYLNRDFIQANLEALPFTYTIYLGFAQREWWAFVLSLIGGLFLAFYVWTLVDQ